MTTTQEAVTEIARCSPEAGGLVAQIMEANAAVTQSMSPSWDEYHAAVQKAYERGLYHGRRDAEERIVHNLLYGKALEEEW